MSDVARLAGVSTMTISRVLNDNPNVTAAMRKRVMAAIEELRYQPNELARSLREQRSRQIGIIVPNLFDPFFATCAHVISSEAKKHSYSVILSTSDENPKIEHAEASRMLRRNVDGLILFPSHVPPGACPLLGDEFGRLPIVSVDRPIEGVRFDSVLVENSAGAYQGTEHLILLGHRKIAYLGLGDELYTMNQRHAGYLSAMKDYGLKPQSVLVSDKREDTQIAVTELMARKKPPTALFCANNLVTRHTLQGLQTLGLSEPESVALVGFDDFETADLIKPGITVVRQPVELLGWTAAAMLFERLKQGRGSKKVDRRVLPVELVVRGSCGASN